MTELAKGYRIDYYSIRLARHKLYTVLSEIVSVKSRYRLSGIKLSNWELTIEVISNNDVRGRPGAWVIQQSAG